MMVCVKKYLERFSLWIAQELACRMEKPKTCVGFK